MSQLTIYKASAGSGKTFTLTREYLKIIFLNMFSYKNILAVTFTNKAANEMKTRILKEVNIIANGEKSDHIEEIIKITKKTKEQTINDAKQIQNRLLHDYSFFSVKTIDSFFQDIIKSFTKEIGLQFGFELELDTNDIVDKAIEKVMVSIEDNKEIKQWLLSFAREKMSEGKRWNFKKDIEDFSKEIFKEKYTLNKAKLSEKLKDRKFLNNFRNELLLKKQTIVEEVILIGEQAIALIEKHHLEITDFAYGKSGFINYFYKFRDGNFDEAKGRVLEAQNNIEKWYSKTSKKKEEITTFYNAGGNDFLNQAIELYQTKIEEYNSYSIVASLVNVFGIIADISNAVGDISAEENLFLISYAAAFINAIINDNDTPFIYEKIGARYKYFMIDEFQDTSSIQWKNFKPLIEDNLAQGNSSLIVGDVKQSIYRWRNSDWKLLSEGVYNDFYNDYIKDVNLEYNYRSKKEIIEFNNNIFTSAKELLQNIFNNEILPEHEKFTKHLKEKLVTAYSNNEQKIPKNNGTAYVRFERIEKIKGEDQKEIILAKIPSILMEIQDKGYKMKDIAFLVRSKTEGAEIVDYIMHYKNENEKAEGYNFNIISNEALFVGSSPVIKLLISLLKDLSTSAEKLNRVFINYEYEIYLQENETNLHSIFSNNELIVEEYAKQKAYISTLSFYEIVEKLIDIFKLNLNSDNYIYLQAFNDLIKDFSVRKSMSIVELLEWWDEKGSSSPISLNENQDAAQILTIHKSKGLEFKFVIIPFADWSLAKSGDILWVENEQNPFCKLDVMPVKYSSTLKKSVFFKDYYNELLQQYVDSLNMLYVAFTRAEQSLFVFARQKSKKEEIKNIGDVVNKILENKIVDNVFELGQLTENKEKEEIYESYNLDEYLANKTPKSLNIKLQSENFFSKDKQEKINKGLLYHKVFENIIYISDVENAVTELVNEGSILQEDKIKFIQEIKDVISNQNVGNWFNGSYEVKNETSIIYNNEVKRPDRIMISEKELIIVDYKFGEIESLSHKKQLNDYRNSLELMGYKNIKSYIWYFNKNKITEVV